MSWRLVAISSPSKLSYKNGFLVVRNDRLTTIHLSEISVILLETTTYNITGMLLAELSHKNIPVIFYFVMKKRCQLLLGYQFMVIIRAVTA